VSGKNFFLRHLWAPTFEWLLLSGNRNILIAEMTSFVPVDDHSLKTIYYLSLPLFILFLMLQHSSPSLLLCVFTYSRERIKKKKVTFPTSHRTLVDPFYKMPTTAAMRRHFLPSIFQGKFSRMLALTSGSLFLSFFFY
jgi:hypothetical protein